MLMWLAFFCLGKCLDTCCCNPELACLGWVVGVDAPMQGFKKTLPLNGVRRHHISATL